MSSAAREKTLILMRHSKAENGAGKTDHDRELIARGRRDAAAAGAWLKEQGLVPDLVICSTSLRTRQTWDAACKGGAQAEFVEFRKSVYVGGVEEALETIREDAGETATVLVIGHNPTIAQLTSLLSDGDGSQVAHDALANGFATSGVAVLRYAGEWADLDWSSCELQRFHVSRG
ncbi:SixA phosphatase family protein [Intrasporangium sp.]|uniref:SixA phosphatase family protein n=1 Tax=Intrasporangium sp. TaxID=1925024 RepID=UPI00293A569E|nr:histidine phosphatase family protein [Intrasporangium sp.]MDV3221256.1 histidine phosphatase family protein [Intrasporangium sp.]